MYSRQLKVYKGIDNVLEFRLMNADQRPINTSAYTPKFFAFDENNNLVIEQDGVILDDGSSGSKGLFTVTIAENDLLNLKQQYLKYNIYMLDANNERVLTYSHSNFDNDASIFVDARTFPGPREPHSITTFLRVAPETQEWTSDTVDAQPALNGNEALHTAAVYTDGYIGDIVIQATLDNTVTESSYWADIATLEFDGTESEPVPVNFNGVFSHLRIKAYADPADTVTKILIKN